MKSLAKFHQSAAQVNFDFRPSDGVRARLDGLMNLKETVNSLQISSKATQDTYPTLNRLLLQLKQLPSQKQKSLADELSRFNAELETRVSAQVEDIERLARLRRCL